MTVAVSVASGTDNIISAFPELAPYRVAIAAGFIILILGINLRGTKESGTAFAIPTYVYISSVMVLVFTGLYRVIFLGETLVAPSADMEVAVSHEYLNPTQTVIVLLLLRAFASGCSALTGIEAIANGVPAFRVPKIKNAKTTMSIMGSFAIVMFIGVTALALLSNVKYVENQCEQFGEFAGCATNPQLSVMAQVGSAVFGQGSFMFYLIQTVTAAVLLLAANTAFNGFPLLTSVLAKDSFAPKALLTRGDRLVYTNGMLSLVAAAMSLILIYQASVTGLIQLYILGVFTSFTIGQIGMIKHWRRGLREKTISSKEARSGLFINGLGAFMTSTVLIIVTLTKFTHGAWLVFIIMPVLWLVMHNTKKYYRRVEEEIALDGDTTFGTKGDYAIVMMNKLNKPQLKALDYALSSKHDLLEAVHVAVDEASAAEFEREWQEYGLQVPLRVIPSPYRDFAAPVIEYLAAYRDEHPEKRIAVYLPKYVVGHWWEYIFHNHRAGRIRNQLLFLRGVMVVLVPWRLESANLVELIARPSMPGDVRRGEALRPAMRRHRGARNKVIHMETKPDHTPGDIF